MGIILSIEYKNGNIEEIKGFDEFTIGTKLSGNYLVVSMKTDIRFNLYTQRVIPLEKIKEIREKVEE